MEEHASQLGTLLELEGRHDDLLERLAELDQRVQKILAECQAGRALAAGSSADRQ